MRHYDNICRVNSEEHQASPSADHARGSGIAQRQGDQAENQGGGDFPKRDLDGCNARRRSDNEKAVEDITAEDGAKADLLVTTQAGYDGRRQLWYGRANSNDRSADKKGC